MADIIQLLPDSVANQIAAGEVVQRPASAVKELLENAVDAGSTEIELIIKDSGKTLIQVVDNGKGMSETDARLSFERHATSKIKNADDLFHIRTMGFRGEALASIAAIAQVELKTRTHNSELGTSVIIEGSEVKEQNVIQTNAGTSIAVKNLFYNVPARRNFLKSDSVELGHIEEEFRRVALVNPDVSFSFYHNEKPLYKLAKSTFNQRIVAVFGDNYKQKLLPVEEETDFVRLNGFVTKIEFAKKTKSEQYFFVNGRFIKHPYLNHAVENAYAELLPEKMHPSYFINLEVDSARIDVNIHPTKTEVKFIDERIIYSILRSAVKKSLGQFTLAPQIEFDPIQGISLDSPPKGYIPKEPTITVNPDFNPFQSSGFSKPKETFRDKNNKENWHKLFSQSNFECEKELDTPAESAAVKQDDLFSIEEPEDTAPKPSVIQVQNMYIVSDIKSGMLIIDQQRAHERVLYEAYMKRNKEKTSIQQLLFPETCRLSPADSETLKELLPEIKEMGFDIEEFGKNTFVVSGVPTDISDTDVHETIEEIISQFKNNLLNKSLDNRNSIALTLARKSSVKTGTRLEQEEMQSIMAALFACECPEVALDGKKIMILLEKSDIQEKFK